MRLVDWIQEGIHGPGAFRFILQPLIAIALAIRDGRHDASGGFRPFFYRLAFGTGERRELLHSAWRTLLLPMVIAFAIDSVLQAVLMGSYRLRSSLGVAILLIAIPYSLARSATCRIARLKRHHRPA